VGNGDEQVRGRGGRRVEYGRGKGEGEGRGGEERRREGSEGMLEGGMKRGVGERTVWMDEEGWNSMRRE